jgi:hypothetical protein
LVDLVLFDPINNSIGSIVLYPTNEAINAVLAQQ